MRQSLSAPAVALVLGFLAAGSDLRAEPEIGGSGMLDGPSSGPPWPLADPCSFTQNEIFELVPGGSVACGSFGVTTDNYFLRVFDLDGEHGFGGQVCIDSLDYAVETSTGNVDLTFNVYCTWQGLADYAIWNGIDRDQDLDPGLVFTTVVTQADADLEFFNQPLGGCCDADTQDLAIEIATEDCLDNGTCVNFFPGADGYPKTKPYYIAAPDCGIDDPINADLITGLGVPQLLMRVNATCDSGGTPDVPATGVVGSGVLLLVLLSVGWLLGRRASRA